MPGKHSLLGPSGASRWLLCPPSARLGESVPETTSSYAEAGIHAHKIAELKLLKYSTPMGPRSYTTALNKLKKDPLYKEDMDKSTDIYLEHIKAVAMSFSATPFISAEKEVSFTEYVPEGWGTADCIIIGDNILQVIDYKNGSGVPVSAEDNPQMMLYALGAYLMYKPIYEGIVDTVRMSIVQPNTSGDPVDTWECSLGHLLTWAEVTVKPAAKLAFDGQGDFNPGEKQCRFCKVSKTCRKRAEYNLQTEGFMQPIQMIPPLISDEEVGDILKRTRDLAGYVKQLEAYALKRSLEGGDIPGFKAVEGRSNRTFSDIDAAFKAVTSSGYDEALLYTRSPITLTAVEALLGKKDFSSILGDYIIKPPGKPTLVEASDKRPPVTTTTAAADDFATSVEE
ncbi:MAG: DUF2800 domain-containing protein [Youngiibacter sp.]|nr:DUF2800 domain-containing protein [Youngiibacter sp.]